jgi:hypothetical protein
MNEKPLENVKTGTYDQMCGEWEELIGEHAPRQWKTYGGYTINAWSRFSMFDSIDYGDDDKGSEWIVKYPDFSNEEVIYEGELTVRIEDWENKSQVFTNPTIKDIFRFFANNHDGHHGYLEGYSMENGELVLHAGS